jgi:hypothetical protein
MEFWKELGGLDTGTLKIMNSFEEILAYVIRPLDCINMMQWVIGHWDGVLCGSIHWNRYPTKRRNQDTFKALMSSCQLSVGCIYVQYVLQ